MVQDDVVREFARYTADGSVEVLVIPDGLPRLTSLLPAPIMDETRRLSLIERAHRSAILDGYHIVSERRIRNPVFDGPGEKTTTSFVVRPCRNKKEAAAAVEQIRLALIDVAGNNTNSAG